MNSGHRNLLILSFTLLVVMLGYAMVLPIMPFYIENLGAGGKELGWLMATYALMQLIFAPIWGVLSDRYGRKSILSVGILGYAVSMLMFGLSTTFWMLFAARSLSGILSSATMPTAMAYIGDNAPQEERGQGMGQLGAAMGIGVIFGPLLAGLLSTHWLALPFFVGSALAFAAFLLVILLLPEARALPAAVADARPAFPWQTNLRVLAGPAGVLLLLVFIMSFGMTNFQGMLGLYVVDRFAFNTKQVGAIWMLMGAVLIVGQGALVGPLIRRLGELRLIQIALAVGGLGFLGVALAHDEIGVWAALTVFVLAISLIGPPLNSFISGQAGEHQGAVMGMNSASTSLGKALGPLWGGYIYDMDITYPFFSGAATLVMGLLLSLFAFRGQTRPSGATAQPAG
jgi:DHA1 family multidrug resistance protein-like MFS transporter